MPRYFFDVTDGRSVPDAEGTELDNLDSARQEAVRLAGTLLAEDPANFWEDGGWRVDVRDRSRRLLFTLDLSATEPAA